MDIDGKNNIKKKYNYKKDNSKKINIMKKGKAKDKNSHVSNRKKKKSKRNHNGSVNINFNQINLNAKNDIDIVNQINNKNNDDQNTKKEFKSTAKRKTNKFNTSKNNTITDKSNFNLNSKEMNYNKENLNVAKDLDSYNINEINTLDYKEAKINDKRTYMQYYLSLIKIKHILIFSFYYFRDYNSQVIKIYIFFYIFVINCTVSAMFYSDDTMHKIYEDKGSFDLAYQLPQIFYSLIISSILKMPLNFLGLYENNILEIKNNIEKGNQINNKNNNKNNMVCIKYKILSFFVITYIFLFFIWFYLGCFCAVYKNTQIHLLKDVSISFALSFITPFFKCLLPGLFRITALKSKTERIYLYNFSKLLQKL